MNYIRHLTGFFDRVCKDHRLNPTHISIYMAIFQFWNINRFKNPLSVSRSEIMELSKVSSKNTYHKVMKELHQFGYFRYEPSYHPLRGSWVYLLVFTTPAEINQHKKEAGTGQVPDKLEAGIIQPEDQLSSGSLASTALERPLNISKRIKHTKLSFQEEEKDKKGQEADDEESKETEELSPAANDHAAGDNHTYQPHYTGKRSVASSALGTRLPEGIPESLEAVVTFFVNSAYPKEQAIKFFHYYGSTGWKIGGKTPIEDWQSAAHNWMLYPQNAQANATNPRNPQQISSGQFHATTNKNYAEPL